MPKKKPRKNGHRTKLDPQAKINGRARPPESPPNYQLRPLSDGIKVVRCKRCGVLFGRLASSQRMICDNCIKEMIHKKPFAIERGDRTT